MCMGGGGSAKVETPKPPPLPPPIPAPPPPKPAPPPPKPVQRVDAKPEIKIGSAKRASSSSRRTPTGQAPAAQSLSIGDNQGLNL